MANTKVNSTLFYDDASTSYRGSLYTQNSSGYWSKGSTGNTLIGSKAQLNNYYPEIYIPELKENLRDNTILTRITNTEWQGKFRNKGDTIVIRHTPIVHNQQYVEGVPIEYEDPEAGSETYTISKARYYAFKVRDVREALSDVGKFASTWTKEGAIQLAEDREIEYFQDVPTLASTAAINSSSGGHTPDNIGVAAGHRSHGYNLGTAAAPLSIYDTAVNMTAGTDTGTKALIVDKIVDCEAVLAEQPGGLKGRPFIVLPTILCTKIKTSELKDASFSGDSGTMLRKDIEAIGSISGFDIFRSNLITKDASTGGYPIIFGDSSAVTFADEISSTEMLRAESEFSSLHRSLCVYDWFLRFPERLGVAYMKIGA